MIEVTNNTKRQQFEVRTNDHLAELVYRFRKKTMFFMHTHVPEALKGQGIGSLMVETGLEYAKAKGFKIAVLCPFTAGYIKKHPEWYALYDREYHQNIPHPPRKD